MRDRPRSTGFPQLYGSHGIVQNLDGRGKNCPDQRRRVWNTLDFAAGFCVGLCLVAVPTEKVR